MRRPLIAGNWKLNKTVAESVDLAVALKQELADMDDADIVVAPVFTALAKVAGALSGSNIALAGQNCHPEQSGAFTGEISPALLKDAGCRYVIVGHSERRQLFGETNSFINKKVLSLLCAGLKPIFCIGETLEEREKGRIFDVLREQIITGLMNVASSDLVQLTVAYEPVWAIGTGKTATDQQAEEVHTFIRYLLSNLHGNEIAAQIRIIYGGSVKPENIEGLMARKNIDGVLVGGASLDAGDFVKIARFQRRADLRKGLETGQTTDVARVRI